MKKLQKPREIPRKTDGTPNPIYFELEVDGIDPQWFRIPNDRIIVELVSLLTQFSTVDDGVSFEGSIDSLAAVVGAAWWDPLLVLETPLPASRGDWMTFGAGVLEELHEGGFGGTTHVALWAERLAMKFGSVLMSPESTLDFGEARKGSETLSDWTSA